MTLTPPPKCQRCSSSLLCVSKASASVDSNDSRFSQRYNGNVTPFFVGKSFHVGDFSFVRCDDRRPRSSRLQCPTYTFVLIGEFRPGILSFSDLWTAVFLLRDPFGGLAYQHWRYRFKCLARFTFPAFIKAVRNAANAKGPRRCIISNNFLLLAYCVLSASMFCLISLRQKFYST